MSDLVGFEQVYEHIRELVDSKLSNFDQNNQSRSQFCELELRLGKIEANANKKNRFSPGVDAQLFFAVEAMLLRGNWNVIHKWTHVTDSFHKPDEVLHKPEEATMNEVGKSNKYDSLRISNIDGCLQKHVLKKTLKQITMKNVGDEVNSFDLRISLALENEVTPDQLKIISKPFMVRIKHRKSFFLVEDVYFKSQKFSLFFRYDLTLIWEGDEIPETERKQLEDREPSSYEIEVELDHITPKEQISSQVVDYVTESFVKKISDLVSVKSCFISVNQ